MPSAQQYEELASRIRSQSWVAPNAIDTIALVRAATLAASSHNTQPWKFSTRPGCISIHPDYARRCPVVDPDDSHLFKSLGCAAENIVHAACAAGLRAEVYFDDERDCVVANLQPQASAKQDDGNSLYEAIFLRQCAKKPFDGKPLSHHELRSLRKLIDRSPVPTILRTSDEDKRTVAGFVARGNTAQLVDPAFRKELISWIRPSYRSAMRTRDGLAGRTLGAPPIPSWLFPVVAKFALTADRQTKTDTDNIMSSAGIAVFICTSQNKSGWVEVGRAYQRFALLAASMRIRTAFINQPVEVDSVRPEFDSWLGSRSRFGSPLQSSTHG